MTTSGLFYTAMDYKHKHSKGELYHDLNHRIREE